MADDMELSDKSLLRTGSLCSPDPHQQLMIAFNDRDFNIFQNILTTGVKNQVIDPNFWYDDPDYGTLLDVACQKPGNYQYIKCLLSCGADPNIINKVRKKSPLHIAVEIGDLTYTKLLINDVRTNVNILDNTGSPPLHYAAKYQNVDIIIALLNHPKVNINQVNRKGQTAIHVAATSGTKESVLCLLQKENIDIDSFKTAQGKTGRDVILENYPELIDKLPNKNDNIVENGTNDNNAQNKLFHVLHKHEIDNFIRGIQINKSYVNANDGYHTFLQYACEFGLYKIVETLLRLGADPNGTNPGNKQTPIMIACYKGYENIVRLLVHNDCVSYRPIDSETVLHSIIKGSTEHSPSLGGSKENIDHYNCLEILLKEVGNTKLNINAGDIKGNTVLHYAAKMNDKKFILLLLHYGAYIGQRNKLNEPALADVNPKIFETYLDNCLTTNDKLPREDNYEIIFRYNFLAPPKKIVYENLTSSRTTLQIENHSTKDIIEPKDELISETDPLLYMSRSSDLRPLLKHPVLTSFLHLKWHKIRSFFYFNLTFYVIFWLLLTTYILMAYLSIDKTINDDRNMKSNLTRNKTDLSDVILDDNDYSATLLRISVAIFLIILILRELFQLTISPLRYIANPENWLEVGLIGITISILFCNSCINLRHQISAIAILLSWAELVLLIGRHPALSTNIEMLKTVSWNFLKFLAWYSILIIAFALSFYTLFCDSDSGDEENYFVDPAMSIFKTVVMLTGEFDAGSIPFVSHPGTSHILFVLFVFLIAIVLFNLLNGLAVSDTQSIKADAELVGYVSRVKLVSYVETMAMGDPVPYNGFLNKIRKLFCCIPDLNCCTINYGCLNMFSRKINLFPELYPDCEVRILPNQESRIEMFHHGHKRKRRDLEGDDENCLTICYGQTMDPEIVRAAKQVLAKKQDEKTQYDMAKVFQSYKEQLEEYKQTLDSLVRNKTYNSDLIVEDFNDNSKDKAIKELSHRLDNYSENLNVLVKNSERTEERLNQILKFLEQKKPFVGTSSSDEDNQ